MKKVIIIGAGATGLTAAYELQKQGYAVTIIERAKEVGGLAGSITVQNTPIERFYHHIFESDTAFIDLINELELSDKLEFKTSGSAIYFEGQLYPFSTPQEMLQFKPLGILDRLRFAASSAILKFTRNWKSLESQKALDWMRLYAGKRATEVIWEPLLRGKFGDKADDISMAWLWARIHFRTFKLGYMHGGFDQVYATLAKKITDAGGVILLDTEITSVKSSKSGAVIELAGAKKLSADAVIATLPQPLFAQLTKTPPKDPLWQTRYLGATCFVLELSKSLIPYYWLNINDPSFPFLAVVEHTNFVDKKEYGGKHVVYIGNYVDREDWRFTNSPEEILEKAIPYLQRLNPNFKKSWITKWHFSKAPFAQPIVTPEYHKTIPAHTTALPRVWLATMSQVYPQDRGQNYAVAMAQKIAKEVVDELS